MMCQVIFLMPLHLVFYILIHCFNIFTHTHLCYHKRKIKMSSQTVLFWVHIAVLDTTQMSPLLLLSKNTGQIIMQMKNRKSKMLKTSRAVDIAYQVQESSATHAYLLKHSGYYMYHSLNISKLSISPTQCICVFFMFLRIKLINIKIKF
jgi:hypothetical protein